MIVSILLASILGTAWGQSVTNPPPIVTAQFLGQNDTDPSISIGNESQSALNVESSLNGTALIKRYGYARTASLTVATSPATGVYAFIDPTGNKQQIVCQDHNCAKSTNNTSFVVFLSTAGGACMPTRWQFAQVSGFLYGVNDCHDVPFRYDGTTFISLSSSPPLGSIIEATKDRLVISGVSANPSASYYSQAGLPTNFTAGINSADPYVDVTGASGDQVRALKYALGRLFVFKTNSISSCILGDQYTSKCFPVSNAVGTSDPLSVIETPGSYAQNGMLTSGAILFRGSDQNYWQLDQTGLNVISKKISKLIATQTAGNNQANTQNTQAAWQAGTQFPASVSTPVWNTTTLAGSIFPSSTTVGDATTAQFSSGTLFTNIGTTTFSSAISLSSNVIQDSFTNGLAVGRLAWATTAGSYVIDPELGTNYLSTNLGNVQGGLPNVISTSSSTQISGSWKFSWLFQHNPASNTCTISGTTCFSYRFMKNAGGDYYEFLLQDNGASTNKIVNLNKNVNGVSTTLEVSSITAFHFDGTLGTVYQFEIQRSTGGALYLYYNNVYVGSSTADNSISSSTKLEIAAAGYVGTVWNDFSTIYDYAYASSGTFISREFDMGFSTPVWGLFSSTFSVNQNQDGQVVFYTQVSTSPNNDLYDAKVASSDTLRILSAAKRYVRYEADLATFVSTKTPTISAVSLLAATTGQFATQCIQPGPAISAWGQLNCAQTLSGNGSEVFYATSAATCGALPTGAPNTWQTVASNNGNITISTNAAMYVGFRSLLTSATDQAQVNACTVYWTNGAASPPSWGTYDPVKNAAYWTSAINNSGTANRVLKYDINLSEWYPFGLNATAIYRDQNTNSIYFGDSGAGYWNKYGGVNSDNGASINAYWISRDLGNQQSPFLDNTYNRISMVTKNQVTGSMTVSYTFSTGQTGSYNVSLATSAAVVYVHSNQNLLKASPYQFMNINLGNNATNGFEVDALQLDYDSFGWRPQNP